MLPFSSYIVSVADVDFAYDGVDPLLVDRYRFKIHRITDQQSLTHTIFQVTVRRFNPAVFVSFSPVVACRKHTLMTVQFIVSPGGILFFILGHVFKSGRQAGRAMLNGNTTQPPKRILKAFAQCSKGLSTEDNLDIAPPAVDQTEMVEKMLQRFSIDRYRHLFSFLKSDNPIRSGVCFCRNMPSLLGPLRAFHFFTLRWNVRSVEPRNLKGRKLLFLGPSMPGRLLLRAIEGCSTDLNSGGSR